MELEDHITKLKIAYQAFKEVEGLSDMTVCDLAQAAHEQWALDKRTEFIQEERAKYYAAKGGAKTDWRSDPATPAQKSLLGNAGISYKSDITKGAASDLIGKLTKKGG